MTTRDSALIIQLLESRPTFDGNIFAWNNLFSLDFVIFFLKFCVVTFHVQALLAYEENY